MKSGTFGKVPKSRSPHGERGLKYPLLSLLYQGVSRSPHGERGLKLRSSLQVVTNGLSLPAWGAWIEMLYNVAFWSPYVVAPRMGSVD